ncbi:MAG: hypothetical protein KBT34_06005 [Prevotella sp.]|nr:hypothetical protein [Candidatus Prevotella equi]
MKKLFFALCALLFSITAMAGSDIEVTQGDEKFFKKTDGTATCVFIWDGATYDGRMALSKKFKNLATLKKASYNAFVEEFNKKSKHIQIVKGKAKYKITIRIKKIDQYFKVTGIVPANATKMWGTLTVTNSAGKKLLVATIDEVDGGSNRDPVGTFEDCFEDLGKQVAKLK